MIKGSCWPYISDNTLCNFVLCCHKDLQTLPLSHLASGGNDTEHCTPITGQSCPVFKMTIFRLEQKRYILPTICMVSSPYLKNPSQFRWTGRCSSRASVPPQSLRWVFELKDQQDLALPPETQSSSSLLCPVKQGLLRTPGSGGHRVRGPVILAAANRFPARRLSPLHPSSPESVTLKPCGKLRSYTKE